MREHAILVVEAQRIGASRPPLVWSLTLCTAAGPTLVRRTDATWRHVVSPQDLAAMLDALSEDGWAVQETMRDWLLVEGLETGRSCEQLRLVMWREADIS